jgi:hypothetical protein
MTDQAVQVVVVMAALVAAIHEMLRLAQAEWYTWTAGSSPAVTNCGGKGKGLQN